MSALRSANRSSEKGGAPRLIAALFAKVVVAAVAIFLLLCVAAPNLVDLHKDLALAGALLCLVAALLIGGWAFREVLIGRRKLAEAARYRVLPPQKERKP